jgi:signal transduction histidine kinase
MIGILPPLISLPGTALLTLVFIAGISDPGAMAQITPVRALQIGVPIAAWLVFGLFVYRISATSTERAQLIRELRAAQEELERAHQRESELAVLRERERLARDLHDNLGHTLVALSVQLEAVQRLYKVDPARAEAQVEQMKALTRSSMDALRRSLAGLRAPGLGEQPLSTALQALCVDAGQRAGFSVECQVDAGADSLAPPVAEALWTAALEALTNVEKHAGARRVQVRLAVEPQAVLLSITDDGRGLPTEAGQQPGHFGLRGMRERIEGLGGTLVVTGDAGTCVEARVPLIG